MPPSILVKTCNLRLSVFHKISSNMRPVISPQELLSLQNNPNLVLIDARAGAGIFEKYKTQHLAGARFAGLETDLSEKTGDPAEGGRHPLPPVEKFARFLGETGITPESHVVVYDDKNGAIAAARFWWMLRALGHKKVQVLDGGFDAALAAGFPTASGEEKVNPQPPYPAQAWQLPVADIADVEKAVALPGFRVIDVRETERYLGQKEPIDLTAGHIPGAVNVPFAGNLDENGFFKKPDELRRKYAAIAEGRDAGHLIVHCGSGVTACHTLLAMDQAGMSIPALYVGSWSEWSRTGREIAKGI
jgi:thiosulfate/3-mercaptopyruvate sulfurtransferase